jgi:hypothetical protein
MSAIMDIYQLVRDLIDEAKEQKNLELVDKLIEIKLAMSDIQEQNNLLKEKIKELEETSILDTDLELLPQGYYIRKSEKVDGKEIRYCVACWQNIHKLMPYVSSAGRALQCNNCHSFLMH